MTTPKKTRPQPEAEAPQDTQIPTSAEVRLKIKQARERRMGGVPAEFRALGTYLPGHTWADARRWWFAELSKDVELSANARNLAEIIRERFVYRKGVRGGVLGAARLYDSAAAIRFGCSPRTVRRARAELADRGWIHVGGASKSGESPTYYICLAKITVWSRPAESDRTPSRPGSIRKSVADLKLAGNMVSKSGHRQRPNMATTTSQENTTREGGLSPGDRIGISRFPMRQVRALRLEVMAQPEALPEFLRFGERVAKRRPDLRSEVIHECWGAAQAVGAIQARPGLSDDEKAADLVRLLQADRRRAA
jgi:hypothetical protein